MNTQELELRIKHAIAAKAESLDLRGLGLKALPPLPNELLGLRAIELGSNRLTAIPEELLALPRLRRLGLGNNRIAILPTNLAVLQELVSLDLSENRLENLPESLGSLSKLIEMSLYANRLAAVPAAIFALKRLERLDLSTNKLSMLPSLAECRYSRMRALDISRNKLTRLPAAMERLRALRSLNLANNQLTTLQGIEGLVLLEELDVSNNELTLVAATLQHLPRLQRLDVSDNLILTTEQQEIVQFNLPREQAAATLAPLISGGESGAEDASYFDQAPFQFNADLAVGHAGAPDLIDLYYKKFSGRDIALQLADGRSLKLAEVSRTRALDFTRSALESEQPVRLSLGQAHGNEQKQQKQAFVVDVLTSINDSQLVEIDSALELAHTKKLGRDYLLQWSDREAIAEQTHRTVGVGFAAIDHPAQPLSELEPLACDSQVWLWCAVAVGDSISGAIGSGQPLAPGILDQAELDVAVFSNPAGFEIETRSGTLRLQAASAFVLRPADIPAGAGSDLIASRLFFKIKTPTHPGNEQLRVHLYHRGLLVQALDIKVSVGIPKDVVTCPAISVTTDYVLSGGLDEQQLLSLGQHQLSIFVNESPGSQAGFRFFGADGEIVGSANIEAAKIGTVLETARQALRQVSWGNPNLYDPGTCNYRYEPSSPMPNFKEDLVKLAKCGFQIWDVFARSFAGEGSVPDLVKLMRTPGVVQLGLKESSAQLLPLAILYDQPIDTELDDLDKFTLCANFKENPNDCLEGNCPNHADSRIVCPSGFWGFRHAIGVPIGCANVDASASVAPADLNVFVSAYAGEFPLRDHHLQELEKLVGECSFAKSLSYDETLKSMKTGGFQLLYFYCHGGIKNAIPYLLVGRDDEDPNRIVRATLRMTPIEWNKPRALVFINGCHTTAMEPEQAIELVNGFIETARASGVIGTEITVFEPLATRIGASVIKSLLAGYDVGTALRDARRALLFGDRPNPLGLVYIAFALSTLKLEGLSPSTVSTIQ